MARSNRGAWRKAKKVARYLVNRKAVIWEYEWQQDCREAVVMSDSDWGGNSRDRKFTSGAVSMLRKHAIKTWSCTQGAYALSSAEAEFYARSGGQGKGFEELQWNLVFLE